MRLSKKQQTLIHNLVSEVFGSSAKVWLFGSRIDNDRKGGDIDLLIETQSNDMQSNIRSEITLLSKLQKKMGEQRIDILLDYPSRKKTSPIFDIAHQEGILL